jgi:hypothetical protein
LQEKCKEVRAGAGSELQPGSSSLKEEDFPQSNLLQHGSKRPQEERRSCSGGQRNKMLQNAPKKFYASFLRIKDAQNKLF